MTQELKPYPCPGCRESLHPEYTSKHEMDAELLHYYHEEETDCVFDGLYLWLENVDKWNALPRHNEPEWFPMNDTAPKTESVEVKGVLYGENDELGPSRTFQITHYRPLPNPPEVTT